MDEHILLLGLNYENIRQSGDKNFWIDLINEISCKFRKISIISIKQSDIAEKKIIINNCEIIVYYLSTIFLATPNTKENKMRYSWKGKSFPAKIAVFEKLFLGRRIIRKLEDIYRRDKFCCIHFMGNFVLTNRWVANFARKKMIRFSISAMAYQGINPLYYHPYLKLSYKIPDVFIIPYSKSYEEKLIALGLNRERVIHIPWGVTVEENSISEEERKTIKNKINIPENRPVFLWAGYIQQITRQSFLFAYKNALCAIAAGLDAVFYFAFKSECFESIFSALNNPGKNIFVQATEVKLFEDIKKITDIFYSPFAKGNYILAPPLTYIELMALGCPILTTEVGGVREIVEDGKTGYIAGDENDLLDKMLLISKNYPIFHENCRQKIKNYYNIKHIAELYVKLFTGEKI